MTVRWYALRKQWPLEKVEVRLTHRKGSADGAPGKIDLFTKDVRVIGTDLTEEQRLKLLDVARKCPVQRTLEGTPEITTTMVRD
jgi:putative redox protein